MIPILSSMGTDLAVLSDWIDTHNNARGASAEAQQWGRLAKVGEEFGEAIQAFIGYTNQNPRKGYYATKDAVIKELLDVALTALAAVEHFTGNAGTSVERFYSHTNDTMRRAATAGMIDPRDHEDKP